jgi:hypothetical protein
MPTYDDIPARLNVARRALRALGGDGHDKGAAGTAAAPRETQKAKEKG